MADLKMTELFNWPFISHSLLFDALEGMSRLKNISKWMFTHDDINEISLDNYFQGLKVSFTMKSQKVEFIDKPTM